MNNDMLAIITWKSSEEGGRKHPPTGEGPFPYCAPVRFLDDNEPWPHKKTWSLIVEKMRIYESPMRWLAEIRFLVDEAPHEKLCVGQRFELYEGRKCVAGGEIIDGTSFRRNG